MLRTMALTLATLWALPGALHAQIKLDEKRSAAPDGVVEIENMAGSITVIAWSRNEVAVTGALGRGAEGLDFEAGPHRTSISVETYGNPHGVSSDLEVRVPAGSRLEIESFSADIKVTDLTGSVTAESVNGSISVKGSREIEVSSVNGGIEVDGPSRRTRAESVNGPVTVRGASGEIEASTVNGRLVVVGTSFERAQLETVSGELRFEGALDPKATLELSSVSGAVELLLPANVAADFSVSSFSGDVYNDFGPVAKRTSRWTSQKELEFSHGGGGASVSVETLSGAIALRKKP